MSTRVRPMKYRDFLKALAKAKVEVSDGKVWKDGCSRNLPANMDGNKMVEVGWINDTCRFVGVNPRELKLG